MDWIGLIITVIIVALIIGIFYWAVGALPFIPPPIAQIIKVFIVVIGALYVISMLAGRGTYIHIGRL